VDFELSQKSVAILLGHLFGDVIVVDTPYKHFARITASHN
jgi:hypothetical protein